MSWLFRTKPTPATPAPVDFKAVAVSAQSNVAAINATTSAARERDLVAQETRQRKELADAFTAQSLKGVTHVEYVPEDAIHPGIVAELKSAGFTIAPGTKADKQKAADGTDIAVPCSIITLPTPVAVKTEVK